MSPWDSGQGEALETGAPELEKPRTQYESPLMKRVSYAESPSNKIEMYGSAQMGVQIRNVKFEIGTKPTD